jgi:hypothetical protein
MLNFQPLNANRPNLAQKQTAPASPLESEASAALIAAKTEGSVELKTLLKLCFAV